MASRALINGWPIVPPGKRQFPPANVVLPTISGTFSVGQVVTATIGTWDGFPVPTLSIRWHRNGIPISGATSLTYTLTDADAGAQIWVTVRATNILGSDIVASLRSLPVSQGGGTVTVLRRETDGTVTVVSLGSTWTPKLTRQSDGTVTVGA